MEEGCPSEGQERVKLCLRVAVTGTVGLGVLTDGASMEDGRNKVLTRPKYGVEVTLLQLVPMPCS